MRAGARAPGGRDRLPVPAAPAVAGPAQRAGLPRDDRGPGRRAVRRQARGGRPGTTRRRARGSASRCRPEPDGAARAGWRRKARRVVGGASNVWVARVMNARRRGPAVTPLGLEAYRALAAPTALDTARLLAGRSNPERARLVETVLDRSDLPVTRHPTGRGGRRRQPLRRHRARRSRAAPGAPSRRGAGSPGANDNAAAVGILLALAARLRALPPRRLAGAPGVLRRRGAGHAGLARLRASAPLEALLGVVSLELCGIGDSLALWDVTPALADTPLLRAWIGAVEGLGYRRDESYHLAEPVPFFGSDHRPFADRGVPAVGLTVVPTARPTRSARSSTAGCAASWCRRRAGPRRSRPITRPRTARRPWSPPRWAGWSTRSKRWCGSSTLKSPGGATPPFVSPRRVLARRSRRATPPGGRRPPRQAAAFALRRGWDLPPPEDRNSRTRS